VELGRLQVVDLRQVWPHEAHTFTPWLLANADVLGEALGMDLDLSHTEHPVGGFSLDLLGIDQATGERVIIENQLETTDHTHLGQLLTYAGGTDPVNVVWLAKTFREEHRAALDWLNSRTDEGTRFFGVEVSVVRIGNSMAAPHLIVVAQPNDWGKQVKATAQGAAVTERSAAYREFWTRFLDRLRIERPGWTRAQKGGPQSWQPLPSGTSYITLTCSFTRGGRLLSEVFFEHSEPAVNTARYQAAFIRRAQIEQVYSRPLSFQELDHRKGCRIGEYRDGDIRQADEWDEYIVWFISAQTALRKGFESIGGFQSLGATVA
jgi:hypothetical protein